MSNGGFYHVVERGESLSRLARTYGLADWKVIYYHDRNESFRKKHPDHNELSVGERVWIPATPNRARSHTGGIFRFFRRAPRKIESLSIKGLKFVSDHDLLLDNKRDWTDTGNRFPKPEWTPRLNSPISHTKHQKLKITVEVEALPADHVTEQAIVRVKGDQLKVSFVDQEFKIENGRGEATLEAEAPLWDEIATWKVQLSWEVDIGKRKFDLGPTGPHHIMLTYDKPYGSAPTVKRLYALTTWVDKYFTDNPESPRDEQGYVDAVFKVISGQEIGHYFLGAPYPNPVWKIFGGVRAECNALADLFQKSCQMLGLPDKFVLGHLYPGMLKGSGKFDRSGKANESRGVAATHPNPDPPHGASEKLIFRDHSKRKTAYQGWNNFEGTVKYGEKYYCIGESCYDSPAAAMEAMVVATVWVSNAAGFCKNPGPCPEAIWDPEAWSHMPPL